LQEELASELQALDQRFLAYDEDLTLLLYAYVARHRGELGVAWDED
jgi:hypothetical protein